MVINMSTIEAQGFTSGLGLTEKIPVTGLPSASPNVLCNKSDICEITLGMGYGNAASSVMALLASRALDLTQTYFIIAGIGGIDPLQGTVGLGRVGALRCRLRDRARDRRAGDAVGLAVRLLRARRDITHHGAHHEARHRGLSAEREPSSAGLHAIEGADAGGYLGRRRVPNELHHGARETSRPRSSSATPRRATRGSPERRSPYARATGLG